MSGNKCSYFNCGLTKRLDSSLRMYRFPVEDIPRCQKWILHCGNGALADLSPKSLRKKYICSRHFAGLVIESRLLPAGAVPLKYTDEDHSTESSEDKENVIDDVPQFDVSSVSTTYARAQPSCSSNVYSRLDSSESESEDKIWLTEIQNLPSCSVRVKKRKLPPGEEIKQLKEQLKTARKKINNLDTQLKSAKRKVKKPQLSAQLMYGGDHRTDFNKSLVNMQLRHKMKSPWLPSEKRTALALFYKGPKTYRYLRQKGVTLPAVSTLKSWIANFNCKPGFNKKMFAQLTLKADTMLPWERKCIMMFDEMAIKRHVEYNRKTDIIEGFEDLGEFGRKSSPASQALVLMIRGVYSKWKIPIAYFVSDDGVTHDSLLSIVTKCLEKLDESKLEPIGIVCDLSSTNQKVFKSLGVDIKNPYFFLNDKKYFAFYDVPHLLKCIRNNFLDNDFLLNGKYIRFSDIRKLYDLDRRSKTGRALLKITDKHLNPNSFEKMSVKLAAQLLSHSVYAALKTSLRTGELTSTTGENTAHFIYTMNNLFDALNCTRLHSKKPCNRVLCDNNPEVLSAINAGYELLKDLQKVGLKGNLTRPYSFDGFLVTINAVKLFSEEQKEKGFKYLFTGRLIQDPLENQFSVYRQKGGYNRNPTVRSFRSAFKINIVTNMMRPPMSANAGSRPDEDDNILNISQEDDALALLNIEEESSSEMETDSSQNSSTISTIHYDHVTSLEQCGVVYFAGYLIKKCLDKYKCDSCKSSLESSEDLENSDELLTFYKNYELKYESGLKTPTELLKKFTFISMNVFTNNIVKYLERNIIFNVKKKVESQLLKSAPEWFQTNSLCSEHRGYMLNLLLRTQVYKYCKEMSSLLTTRKSYKNVKLSILQHK